MAYNIYDFNATLGLVLLQQKRYATRLDLPLEVAAKAEQLSAFGNDLV